MLCRASAERVGSKQALLGFLTTPGGMAAWLPPQAGFHKRGCNLAAFSDVCVFGRRDIPVRVRDIPPNRPGCEGSVVFDMFCMQAHKLFLGRVRAAGYPGPSGC